MGNPFADVPIDPLTGEPFWVADKRDTLDIASAYLKDGESAVIYKVRQALL